jgi:hypothetical protein
LDLDAVDDNCSIDSIQNSNSSDDNCSANRIQNWNSLNDAQLDDESVDNVEETHVENESMTRHRIPSAQQLSITICSFNEPFPCFDVQNL